MLWPFHSKAIRSASLHRFRLEVTLLESRWVPSTFTEFALPPLSFGGNFGATGITAGPDGNVWFTDPVAGNVGRIAPSGQVTEFASPIGHPGVIAAGPDGNLWFSTSTLSSSPAIGRITPDGQVASFPVPDQFAGINALSAGPDGNVWFTEFVYPSQEKVGRITPNGQLTQFTVTVPPGSSATAGSITAGADGNLYFSHDGVLASISPNGVIRDDIADNVPLDITTGPDGYIWASGPRFDPQTGAVVGDMIERISPQTGSVTTFNVGTTSGSRSSISAGPDGNLWFTEPDSNEIGRITPAGQITLFHVPTSGSQPTGIVAGPNRNIWFTEAASRHVGEYFLTGSPPAAAAPTTAALATDVSAPSVGQTIHLTATVGSSSGTPSGTVTFFDGTIAIGSASLDAGGKAVLTTAFATAGNHTVTAVFNGTADFAPSRSAALVESVHAVSTTTTLTASPNPVLVGKTVTFTAIITPTIPGAGVPTGVVLFRVDGNFIGYAVVDHSGHAALTVTITRSGTRRHPLFSPFGRGTHVVTAEYAGDGNFALSLSPRLTLTVV